MPVHKSPIVIATCLIAWTTGVAREEYSNGRGGGYWSDPATWRTGAVPGADAVVVIGRDDNVIFDRNDIDRVTCRQLFIDKKGKLSFKTKAGRIRASFGGLVQSNGAIRLDGTASREDRIELRMVGATMKVRLLRLRKSGSLTVVGRTDTVDGKPNVLISSVRNDERIYHKSASVSVSKGSGLDIQRAQIVNVTIDAHAVDNTGAKFNERLNIAENLFSGNSNIYLNGCDTPLVINNRFERDSQHGFGNGAITVHHCELAEIRGNDIIGKYNMGIHSIASNDVAITQNVIDGCNIGFYWWGKNFMIQDMTIRNTRIGIELFERSTGAVDGLITENCKNSISFSGVVQISNWVTRKVPEKGKVLACDHGQLELLNSGLNPEQVVREPTYAPFRADDGSVRTSPPPPMIQAMYYLVVGLKGKVPKNAWVGVKTANPAPLSLAPGAIDPNIRNSPAPVRKNNLTPLSGSQKSLIVNAWKINSDGTVIGPPTYTVSVLVPAAEKGEFKTIKSLNVTPESSWFRPHLKDATPTVELTLE